MGKILEVKNLTIHIKTHKGVVQAVRGVDFYLNEQETLAVVGESGSGKSITMKGVMENVSRWKSSRRNCYVPGK